MTPDKYAAVITTALNNPLGTSYPDELHVCEAGIMMIEYAIRQIALVGIKDAYIVCTNRNIATFAAVLGPELYGVKLNYTALTKYDKYCLFGAILRGARRANDTKNFKRYLVIPGNFKMDFPEACRLIDLRPDNCFALFAGGSGNLENVVYGAQQTGYIAKMGWDGTSLYAGTWGAFTSTLEVLERLGRYLRNRPYDDNGKFRTIGSLINEDIKKGKCNPFHFVNSPGWLWDLHQWDSLYGLIVSKMHNSRRKELDAV